MTEFDAGATEWLQAHVDEHGFLSWLGVQVEAVEPGHVSMRVPYEDRLTNPRIQGKGSDRTVHGGIAATLVDTTGGIAVRSDLSEPLSTGVATIDLNLSYLRPATADLVATAETVRVGRTIGVAEVEVASTTADGERVPVVVGRGTYRVFRDE